MMTIVDIDVTISGHGVNRSYHTRKQTWCHILLNIWPRFGDIPGWIKMLSSFKDSELMVLYYFSYNMHSIWHNVGIRRGRIFHHLPHSNAEGYDNVWLFIADNTHFLNDNLKLENWPQYPQHEKDILSTVCTNVAVFVCFCYFHLHSCKFPRNTRMKLRNCMRLIK